MARHVYTHAYAIARFFADPADVTRALWLPSDQVHSRERLWSFSSDGCVNVPELDAHLRWLLGLLEFRAAAVALLLAKGITAKFVCYSRGSTAKPPSLSREVRRRAAALGMVIEIDHVQVKP